MTYEEAKQIMFNFVKDELLFEKCNHENFIKFKEKFDEVNAELIKSNPKKKEEQSCQHLLNYSDFL